MKARTCPRVGDCVEVLEYSRSINTVTGRRISQKEWVEHMVIDDPHPEEEVVAGTTFVVEDDGPFRIRVVSWDWRIKEKT